MNEIRTLRITRNVLTTCPVLELKEDEDEYEVVTCGGLLDLILEETIIGDDYGSWPVYSVGYKCGHTNEEMVDSIRNAEYV